MCILGSKSGIQNKVETFYVQHFNVETVTLDYISLTLH